MNLEQNYIWGAGLRRAPHSGIFYLTLFALNLRPAWRLLRLEYHEYFVSIEGAFLGLERYIAANWPHLSWYPLWHAGMPFQDAYVPLYHFAVVSMSKLSGFSIARSYHVVAALTYALGPVGLAWMMRRFGATRLQSFLAAALWSLFSLSGVIMPGTAADMGSPFFSRRLQVAVMWAEGPHVASLGLQCFAIGAFHRAYRQFNLKNAVAAALAVGITGLINVPGTMALCLSLIAWAAAIGITNYRRILAVCVPVGFLSYLLICWLVPPSSILTILANSKTMHPGFNAGGFCLIFLLIFLFALGHILDGGRGSLLLRFAMIELILFSFVCLTSTVKTYELIPQGGRLHLEMDRSAAMLGGLALASFLTTLFHRRPVYAIAAAGFALMLGVVQFQNVRQGARQLIKSVKVEERSEFKTAKWLEQNAPAAMTYATGSTSFWLNAFAQVPQLTGCCDQGNPHRFDQDVAFQINHSKTSAQVKNALDWAKLYGVKTLVANTGESTEAYRDFENASKLDEFLPLLHAEAGDRIYKLQELDAPRVYVVKPGEWIAQKVTTMQRTNEMQRLLAAIERGGTKLAVSQVNPGYFQMAGDLSPDDRLWVQASYVPGWRLKVNGIDKSKSVATDGLGLIVLEPQCNGICKMELRWGGTPDLWWARLASFITLIGLAAAAFKRPPIISSPQAPSIS